MATTTKRGSSTRASSGKRQSGSTNGASASSRSNGRSSGKSSAPSRARSNGSRSRAASSGSSRARQATSSASKSAGKSASSSSKQNGSGGNAITRVVVPAMTGAVGVAGGILLDRTRRQRSRKVLGVPVPDVKLDMAGIGRQLGEAAQQFGRLAHEVRVAREKAEKIGRAIS